MSYQTTILMILYSVAWAVCPLAGAEKSTVGLAVAASLVTFPFFVMSFARIILINTIISFGVMAIGVLVPPLGFILAIWATVCLFLKLGRLLRAMVPMMAGFVLYCLLLKIPCMEVVTLSASDHSPLGSLAVFGILGAVGWSVIWLALKLFQWLGYSDSQASAPMLGFPVYLTLFIISFLIPGLDRLTDGPEHQ